MSNSSEWARELADQTIGYCPDPVQNGSAVLVVGDGHMGKIALAKTMALLGSMGMSPLIGDYIPKRKPSRGHERHQGEKERERRIKRLKAERP